jgi:hypothetical protein
MRAAPMAHLERALRATDEPDPEQRGYRLASAEGAVLAYERIGVLSSEEAERWRTRLADAASGRGLEVERPLSEDARAAGADYLGRLLARVAPLRRRPDTGEFTVQTECASAIDALHAVGALDDSEHADWHARLLAAEAPWLDDPAPPSGRDVAYAIEIPAETDEEAAEDAAAQAAWEARPEAATVSRVVIGSPERHAGLAMVALCVHEDATSLHFHFLGGHAPPEASQRKSLKAFSDLVDGLEPPALRDDRGTVYEPVDPHPNSASGTGGVPDSERRQVVTGAWLYTPAALADAAAFVAEQGAERWTLTAAP